MLTDLAYLTDSADGALVLGVVLRSVKRTLLERSPAIDGRVARSADLKLGELVELNLYGVIRVPFALSLRLLGLCRG
jgi:hypothetical protein